MDVVNTSRREKAAVTRRRMVDSAYVLFCESGYRATTMAAIADRAGVAVQTLYFTFRTKDELLQEVHECAVFGGGSRRPTEQRWFTEVAAEADAQRAISSAVEASAVILARVAPMLPVFHAAAGDAAGVVFRRGEDHRRRDMRQLAELILSKTGTRGRVSVDQAADLFYVLLGPETYRSFVLDLGWSTQAWIDWTSNALTRELCETCPE
ncbi:TetR/AcrR family transcriptional regulator [Microlunatus lacustris]